jgi:hypothetical protein
MSRRGHGGGSLMVWAAFCFYGKSEIVIRPCRGDSVVYQKLLQANLLPFIRRLGAGRWIFQQDNASVHASASTKEWLERKRLENLPWPALSPDLNPIENLWGQLARAVYDDGRKQYDTVEELRHAVVQKWAEIELASLETLIESMPQRMYQVIRNGGAQTKY